MMKKKLTSMHEFAKASGVSRPTLSKYFKDPALVKGITRKQIEAALKEFNFEPNLFARNLKLKQTRNVGIIVPTMSDPFFAQIVSLIELKLQADGYWPIPASSHRSPEYEAQAVKMLRSMKVAGAIIAPLGTASLPDAFTNLAQEVPVVSFDRPASIEQPFVGNDNAQSVSKMVRYLCRTGEAPVYFEIPSANENTTARQTSYEAAMRAEGLSPLIIRSDVQPSWDYERQGYEQIQKTIANGGLPGKTLLCANDRFAFGAIAAAYEAGYKIGRAQECDLRIAGHDDHPLSKYICPALTTMAQDAEGIAAQSVEILKAGMAAKNEGLPVQPELVLLEAKLQMRASA